VNVADDSPGAVAVDAPSRRSDQGPETPAFHLVLDEALVVGVARS
jgi:hypothetical protein